MTLVNSISILILCVACILNSLSIMKLREAFQITSGSGPILQDSGADPDCEDCAGTGTIDVEFNYGVEEMECSCLCIPRETDE